MKRCPTCKQEKALSAFYRDKRTPDGLKSQCKACHVAGNIRTRDEDKKRDANLAHMQRARASDPEKFRVRDREAARLRQPNERIAARRALNSAIRAGKITPPASCPRCGRPGRPHAHHPDYANPLEVEWLCSTCHGKEHRT